MRKKLREGQVGKFWPEKKSGRERNEDPWCLTWYDADAHQTRCKSLGTTDFQEACLKVAEWAVLHDKPTNAAREEVMISSVCLMYWEEHGKRTASARNIKRNLRCWTEYWGDKAVSDIKRVELLKFIDHQAANGLGPASIDHVLSTGRAALNYALKMEVLELVPRIFLTMTEAERRDRDPLARPTTPEEAAKFFDAIQNPRLMAYTIIAATTLSRPCAIYDLRRVQFNSAEQLLELNPKGRKQTKKHRPIIPVVPTLDAWLGCLENPDDYYISGSQQKIKSVRTSWEVTCKRAGIPAGFNTYSFRHGISRWMRDKGVPGDQIDYLLGHLPLGKDKMLHVYAPMLARHCKEALVAIEGFLNEVRKYLKKANLDDPKALFLSSNGRTSNGVNLTPETYQRMDQLILAGRSGLAIGRELGCSDSIVSRRRREMGVRARCVPRPNLMKKNAN